jgi:hypothetical protein
MNNPARTTVVYALAGGFLVVPTAMLLSPYLHWATAFKLTLWADLAIYAVLLARWSRTPLLGVLFPLALLLGTALWPRTYGGFFFLAAGVLCWIRSGACFKGAPLRALAAEVITVLGGCSLVMLFGGRTPLSWAIAVCLFSLVQTLYFFIVPLHRTSGDKPHKETDPFDRAVEEARKVLEGY